MTLSDVERLGLVYTPMCLISHDTVSAVLVPFLCFIPFYSFLFRLDIKFCFCSSYFNVLFSIIVVVINAIILKFLYR